MDINDIRSAITVISFVVFIAILVWAWSSKRTRAFEEAARLPFAEDDRDCCPKPNEDES